jgi:hypothetical protein
MNDEAKSTVPSWYWVVAAIALIWNLLGCAAFAMELFAQEAAMESMTDVQREWARSLPGWIYLIYGAAVGTGVAGSITLFLRRTWAVSLFGISLAAVLVQMIYSMLIAGGLQAMGPSGAVMPTVVIALAAALLWFSFLARRKSWLR